MCIRFFFGNIQIFTDGTQLKIQEGPSCHAINISSMEVARK
jgi:hypothetical protein